MNNIVMVINSDYPSPKTTMFNLLSNKGIGFLEKERFIGMKKFDIEKEKQYHLNQNWKILIEYE